jgi:hypothetical protein
MRRRAREEEHEANARGATPPHGGLGGGGTRAPEEGCRGERRRWRGAIQMKLEWNAYGGVPSLSGILDRTGSDDEL